MLTVRLLSIDYYDKYARPYGRLGWSLMGKSRRMDTAPVKSPHGFWTRFFYGVGSVAFGVKDNGFGALLLLFYNQALGLDARLAGLAIGIALVVDAFLDPLIGYASDRLRTRWGRRHPFMYAAALPAALSYLFLFSPPRRRRTCPRP